jgi:hypothetical protein
MYVLDIVPSVTVSRRITVAFPSEIINLPAGDVVTDLTDMPTQSCGNVVGSSVVEAINIAKTQSLSDRDTSIVQWNNNESSDES